MDELAAIEKEVEIEEAELTTEEDSAIVFTNGSENNVSRYVYR